MKLSNIRLESIRDGYVRAVVDVDSIFYDEKKLWFEVPEEYKDWLSSDVYDAFLIAVLYPCMKHKDDIEIDGAMSKKLHRNLMNYAMKNIKDFSKELSVIEVNVRNYKIPDKRYHHVGTGFSGGVDSFSVINDRFALESDKEYKVDTFLCFNAGSHGDWDDSKTENKFWSRYEYLSSFPKEIGLPYIPLNTNVHAFMDEGHQQSGLTRNLSSVLSLQAAFDKYYYASTYSYWEEEFYGRKLFEVDLAEFAEPHLIQWLSTESITLIPEGGNTQEQRKQQKLLIISTHRNI